jgi:hypothetical protein
MSTEAAGEATHETVEAGREVTAVTVAADEAPGAARKADGGGRDAGPGSGPRTAAGAAAEPGAAGEAGAEPDRPSVGSGSAEDAAGEAGAEPGPDGEHDEGAAGPSASAGAEAGAGAAAGDDREPDPDDGPDGASAEADADDGAATADEADGTDDADQADADGADGADGDEDPGEAGWPDDEDPAGDDDLAYDEYDYDDYADDEEVPGDGDTGRPRRWPRVLLVAGFVLAAAAIVGGALAIVGSVTHGFKKPVKVTYKKSALFSLKTGDCFNPLGQAYTLTSCDDPHQAEVFATFALSGGKYPGSTAIAASAAQGCASRLTSYLNPQLAISLASTYVYPDATAWQAGTRTVICEVQASSGQLTGSVRGASATAG